MKGELPDDKRAEVEARVTAMLLGELSEAETAELREILAKDAALAKWRDQLAVTLDLVRESTATSAGSQTESAGALRLSPARREALLAKFKTVELPTLAEHRKRRRSWVVPLAAAAAIMLMAAVLFHRRIGENGSALTLASARDDGGLAGNLNLPDWSLFSDLFATAKAKNKLQGKRVYGIATEIPKQRPEESQSRTLASGEPLGQAQRSQFQGVEDRPLAQSVPSSPPVLQTESIYLAAIVDGKTPEIVPSGQAKINAGTPVTVWKGDFQFRSPNSVEGGGDFAFLGGRLDDSLQHRAQQAAQTSSLNGTSSWALSGGAVRVAGEAEKSLMSTGDLAKKTEPGGVYSLNGVGYVAGDLNAATIRGSGQISGTVAGIGAVSGAAPPGANSASAAATREQPLLAFAEVQSGGAGESVTARRSLALLADSPSAAPAAPTGNQGAGRGGRGARAGRGGRGGGGGGGFGGGGAGVGGGYNGTVVQDQLVEANGANKTLTGESTADGNLGLLAMKAPDTSGSRDSFSTGEGSRDVGGNVFFRFTPDNSAAIAQENNRAVSGEIKLSVDPGQGSIVPGGIVYSSATDSEENTRKALTEEGESARLRMPNSILQPPPSAASPAPPAGAHDGLYTRVFKVDPQVFVQGLQGVASATLSGSGGTIGGGGFGGGGVGGGGAGSGASSGSVTYPVVNAAGGVGGGVAGGAGDTSGGLAYVTRLAVTSTNHSLVTSYLKSLGVDVGTNNGQYVYYDDRTGELLIHAREKALDTVAQTFERLTPNGAVSQRPPVSSTPALQTASLGASHGSKSVREKEAQLVGPESRPTGGGVPTASANAPVPQAEVQTRENAFSTFSLNVSDVSFKLAAASLDKGKLPEAATVRSEEFINAFDYRDAAPASGAAIGFSWDRAGDPFAHNRDLLRFAIRTAAQGRAAGRPLNLVLMLDKSGSMERSDRVAIIREALGVLASQLQPQDTISVVVFARTARLWADGLTGSQFATNTAALEALTPEGGTNLEEAMRLAYATALRHYQANGENRVVVLTDGAANLGDVDPQDLQKRVQANRTQGIVLDCFGVAWEDFNDTLLEALSRAGGGRYGFVNTPKEADTEFAGQLAGALRVAASDVKVQVEFNPDRVASWRQIGYAKDKLTKEQFRDNTVKAAQLSVEEAGNALYTVELKPQGDGPIATVHVRYRAPGTADYYEHAWNVPYAGTAAALDAASPGMRLAGVAAAFSEWLAASPYAGGVTLDRLAQTLRGVPEAYGADQRPQRLATMISEARSISGK